MRTRPIQMNFSNGEIAPRLFGRSDLAKYWASLEELQNFVILPYGGVTRRDGLHYVADQGIETRKVRLLPFIFSTEQAYIVEAGHEYMRFFMNHGQIQSTPSANTVLLLHMNGLDGSNVFTDDSASAHVVTAQGTAQIDTDYQKFGSGSGLFASAGSAYLSIPDHADFNFSADDIFTFETNIRISSLATTNIIFSHETDADNLIMLGTGSTGRVNFSVAHTGVWQVLSTDVGTISVDTWYHVRVVGDGTNYYLFVNGELLVEEAIVQSTQDYTGIFYIGANFTYASFYNGWMDEFRISDEARSITDFAPPTQEYPLDETIYEIATPYLEGDLPLLKYFQSYDTMYIFHPDYAWRKLTRSGHATWSLSVVDFTNGPWLEELSDVEFTPSATTGNITIASDVAFFLDDHDGSLLRLYCTGAWGYIKITAVLTSQSCTATVVSTLGAGASTAYQEGAWSGVRGYPSSGAFNEASLVVAANDNQPQTIWASKKGDYENFDVGTGEDDEAFIYTIAASNRILWPGALKELILGTGDGMYPMTGGMDDYISPTNVRVRPGMSIGAMNLGPLHVNNSLLYWQKGGRKLRELTYDPNSIDVGYVAPDLSLLADHITLGGVKYSAWQQEPNSILWSVRADGVLLAMTYMRPEDIVGWGRHITDGEIESVAVIPDPTDTFNEVWVSVKREALDSPDANTVLLLRMDGVDGSTTFIDSSASGHTVTAHGTAQIDTDQSKFGGSSGIFQVAGSSYLTIPDHTDFDWSADDVFTIETFVRYNIVDSGWIAAQNNGTNNYWQIYVSATGSVQFDVENAGSAQQLITSTGVITADTWYHIRVVGDGTNYYLFVDGVLLDSDAIAENMQNFTSDLTIGADVGLTGSYLNAWLDEFKISGVARSITDFDVPTANLGVHRYIEYMDPNMMVDSGLTYSGAAVSSVSGLGHLEGKTVDIVGDDVVYNQGVVTERAVAISPAASEIQVGLPYTSKLITMKPVVAAKNGTTAGLPKKWSDFKVAVHETSGLTINDEVVDFRAFSDVGLGEAIPLYTGDVRVSQLGWGDGRITVEHDDPLPCTILGIYGDLESGD